MTFHALSSMGRKCMEEKGEEGRRGTGERERESERIRKKMSEDGKERERGTRWSEIHKEEGVRGEEKGGGIEKRFIYYLLCSVCVSLCKRQSMISLESNHPL